MSILTRRTKIIIGVALTVSLALNFFFLGWLAGASPQVPRPFAGLLGGAADFMRPPPDPEASPEQHYVRYLARDLSDAGRQKMLSAVKSRTADILDLERQAANLRRKIADLLLQPEPNPADIAKQLKAFDETMQRRIAVVREALLPAVLELSTEDRRHLVERWAFGRGGPPPPPPE